MKNYIRIVSILSLTLFSSESLPYPHFVGLGYTSCLTCHYNPFGSGPLNDYGRALSATAVSARTFYSDDFSEEEIANKSGFFFTAPKNNFFRPSLDYRGLLLKRNFGEENTETEFINMMLDLNLVLKNATNSLIFSSTVGYAPVPISLKDSDDEVEEYRLRELYLGWRMFDGFGVYVGLMDKIYGLRIAEHTAYSRSITNLTHNDQSYGIQLHYNSSNFEIGAGYFIGNLVQEENLRQVGASIKADYVLSHKSTIGVSALSSQNEFLENYMGAFHFKTAVGKGSAFMTEYGTVNKKNVSTSEETQENYLLSQAYLKLSRGTYLLNSVEHLKENQGDSRLRFGPGLQLFPIQRLELRFEFYNTRYLSDSTSTEDSLDFLGQAHLWF